MSRHQLKSWEWAAWRSVMCSKSHKVWHGSVLLLLPKQESHQIHKKQHKQPHEDQWDRERRSKAVFDSLSWYLNCFVLHGGKVFNLAAACPAIASWAQKIQLLISLIVTFSGLIGVRPPPIPDHSMSLSGMMSLICGYQPHLAYLNKIFHHTLLTRGALFHQANLRRKKKFSYVK